MVIAVGINGNVTSCNDPGSVEDPNNHNDDHCYSKADQHGNVAAQGYGAMGTGLLVVACVILTGSLRIM